MQKDIHWLEDHVALVASLQFSENSLKPSAYLFLKGTATPRRKDSNTL